MSSDIIDGGMPVFDLDPSKAGLKALIAWMDDLMASEPAEFNHAGTPADIADDLIRHGCLNSFVEFETLLRERKSKVFCVAAPLDYDGSDYGRYVYNPWTPNVPVKYILCFDVNGQESADNFLSQLGMTAAQNLDRLSEAGWVDLKQYDKNVLANLDFPTPI